MFSLLEQLKIGGMMLAGLLFVAGSTLIYAQHQSIINLNQTIAMQEVARAIALEDANKTAVRIEKEVIYITQKTKPIIKYIETYKGDDNATSCKNSNSLLSGFTY